MEIPVEKIKIGSDFRKEEEGVAELALSIEKVGLINPITLHMCKDGTYEVSAGRRRFLALTKYLKKKVFEVGKDCLIDQVSEVDPLVVQLVENFQRLDFKPLEAAELIYTIHERQVEKEGAAVKGTKGGWRIKDTANLIGLGTSTVAQYIKMWKNRDLVDPGDGAEQAIEKVRAAKATRILKTIRSVIAGKVKDAASKSRDDIIRENIKNFVLADAREWLLGIDDESVDHVITDPPYGINLDEIVSDSSEYGAYEDNPEDYKELMEFCIPQFARIVKEGFVVIWCADRWANYVVDLMEKAGIRCSNVRLYWYKPNTGGFTKRTDKLLGSVVETAVYGWKGDATLAKPGHINLLKAPTIKKDRIHVAQKPEDLYVQVLNIFTKEGDVVVDCFAGSGAIVRAGIKTNRRILACEIDEDNYNAAMAETIKAFGEGY